ncbi:MAG: flagellar biosynthesis protein FlhB [Firmicutes bacterium]|nr:flagellar biosynthesis protein FlhB [Bacillota bacterium]
MNETREAGLPLLPWDLQFFAEEEKTEEATPRKKREARRKGQVPRSIEFNSVLVVLVAFVVLNAFGGYFIRNLYRFLHESFQPETLNMMVDEISIIDLLAKRFVFILTAFLPVGAAVLVTGVAINLLQTRGVFTTETLKPRFDRINPVQGLKRLFSPRSLVELIKALFKLGVIAVIIWKTYREQAFPLVETSLLTPVWQAVEMTWRMLYRMVMRICLFLLVMAVGDYMYQRYEYYRNLRMTKKEVKDEYKQTEGDPLVRSRIRRRQREMATRRMMSQVPRADVVITNPTQLAVALRYDPEEMNAPQVVAKGEGYLAERIRALATEHNVPVVENKPLARALYKTVEVDDYIPAHLYQAVAEVLAFIYQLRQGRRRAQGWR